MLDLSAKLYSRSGSPSVWLRAGTSALALGVLLASVPVLAQENSPQDGSVDSSQQANTQSSGVDSGPSSSNVIVVTGIRASLANAQAIKRNSDTVVDAITAEDIGALPDRSVTEALQRVPGVQVSRFAGSNDPDHFSVEGSGVTVRGLNFVRSEFNGRDAFSAGIGGQSLNFADVPAELLGSVEVYKNATAAMTEGGLAGTVNLNTRKPFDNGGGLHIGYDLEGNYGDFEKKWSPTASFLISDTWDTGAGRFGLLADVSYSRIRSRADGIQITNYQLRDNQGTVYQSQGGQFICRNPLPGDTDTTTLPASHSPCGTAETPGADGFADTQPGLYAPLGGQYRSQDYDRKRDGVALAAQFETNDGSFKLTGQYIRSHTTNAWGEHTFEAAPDLSEYNTYPIGCQQNTNGPLVNPTDTNTGTTRAECPVGSFTNYTYDSNGLFQSGYITLPGTGYRTGASGNPSTTFIPTGGMPISLSRRQVYETNTNSDYGLNAEIHPSDRWHIALDADYTHSKHTQLDFSVFGSTYADQELDTTGRLPTIISHKPNTISATWANPKNPVLEGPNAEGDAAYFADSRVQFWRAAMDHAEHSEGDEYQFKADTTYDFEDDSFLKKLDFGFRYAGRDETVRYSTYNWGMLSEVWSNNAQPVSINQYGSGQASLYDFQNFFRGATNAPPAAYYYSGDLINNYQGTVDFLNQIENQFSANGGTSTWVPLAGREGVIPGTDYLPNEVQRVKQDDWATYAMLSFNSDDVFGGARLAGNVGVRFVNTRLSSFGNSRIPSQADLNVTQTYAERCPTPTPIPGIPVSSSPSGVCLLGETGYNQLQNFLGQSPTVIPTQAVNHYSYWLPSLNVKLGLSNDFLIRFAASKVLTRPELSLVRAYQSISIDGNGNFQSQVGNPYLKPATAWQFDLTAEWYFSRVGSLTIDAFYKDVQGFFYQSVVSSPIENNGVAFDFLTRGPANYDGHGKIKGVEIAYQQTFDFLPGILSGLGFTGNYSYIDSSGLPNSFLNGGTPVTNVSSQTAVGNLPFEGLSKHNVNATLFYEKGPVSLRAAYNWRSKFLLTAADVIFPYTSIFQDAGGQLDASAFITVNKHVKVGVQAVNLLNQVTKTLQAYSGDPNNLAPRSYFMNDRRFSFILRGSF
ncbi:TonB-dependent receptor [Porphyrobacter algicida]|uniref:TonB-dependent receptor n=1 Tax=Qipengyuania algicida TaxID=1836209 RepID=A0A845AFN7_9SPHN|nr:TonB-dependent receptor [Qipengyuania algicida]MXP28239.1 TonB-dependent receptor [Qipengyuania algicida]